MKKGGRNALVAVVAGFGSMLLLGLFTPAGPWLTTRIVKLLSAGEGWELSVDAHTGSFFTGFALHQVEAHSVESGIHISLERLDASLWDRSLALSSPAIRMDITPVKPAPPDTIAPEPLRLPVNWLPAMQLTDGSLDVHWTDTGERLQLRGVGAHYTPGPTEQGVLELGVSHWVLRSTETDSLPGHFKAALRLAPASVWLDSMAFGLTLDTLHVDLEGSGRLLLEHGYPVDVALQTRLHDTARTIHGRMDLETSGLLEPLDMQFGIAGDAEHPLTAAVNWAARGRAEGPRLTLDSLHVALLGGHVAASGGYDLDTDRLNLRLDAEDMNLSGLLEGWIFGPSQLNLQMTADLAAKHYDLEGRLIIRDLVLGDAEPFTVQADLRHRPDHTTSIELSSRLGWLEAAGTLNPVAGLDPGQYDLVLEGQLDVEPWLGLTSAPVRVGGRLRGADHQVLLSTDHAPGPLGERFGVLALDLHLRDHRDLQARLTLEEQQLQMLASIDLAAERLDTLKTTLAPLALERLAAGVDGTVSGNVQASGRFSGEQLQAQGSLHLDGLAYQEWHTGPVRLELAYADQRLHAILEGSGLNIDAVVDTTMHMDLTATFTGAMLYTRAGVINPADRSDNGPDTTAGNRTDASSAQDERVAASLTGQLTWQGPLAQPEAATGKLDLEDLELSYQEWSVYTLSPLALVWSHGRLTVDQAELNTPLGPLNLRGSLAADSLSLNAVLPAVDWSRMTPGLEATGSVHLKLSGSTDVPHAHGTVTLNDIMLDKRPVGSAKAVLAFDDSLRLDLSLDQTALAQSNTDPAEPAAEIVLRFPSGPLRGLLNGADANAAYDIQDTRATLELAARQVNLNAVLTHLTEHPSKGHITLDGTVALPIRVILEELAGSLPGDAGATYAEAALPGSSLLTALDGTVTFRALHFETELNGTPVTADLVPGGTLVAHNRELVLSDLQVVMQRFDRDLRRDVKAGRVRFDGALSGEALSRLELLVEDLDLELFDGPDGTANMRAVISGTPQQPELDVALDLTIGGLGQVNARLARAHHADAIELGATFATVLGDTLVVHGQVPWNHASGLPDLAGGTASLRTDGLDLQLIADMLADFAIDHVEGRLTAAVDIVGLTLNAELHGQITVDDLGVRIADIDPTYRFPQGRLVFTGHRLDLENFHSPASRQNGRMDLTGHIVLEQLDAPEYDLQLRTDGLRLMFLDVFDADHIDLRIDLTGTTTSARLAGEVRIRRALAEPLLVAFNAPPVPPPPPTLRDEFLEQTALDLVVDIRNLKFDTELANADVSGAIDIGGTFQKPIFQGGIQIDEGSVFILNREFLFEHGRIVLNNLEPTRSLLDVAYDPLILNPELDLSAQSSVIDRDSRDEYVVQLDVRGTARNPAPQFTSMPALDFNSIFRLLAFGSTQSQMEYSAALGTAAGQLLSKHVERVGLDEFTVLPSGSVIGTVGLTTLRLGKYFENLPLPVWVQYEAALTDMSSGEVRLEHRLLNYLTVSGTAHSKYERYGLGLGLRRRF